MVHERLAIVWTIQCPAGIRHANLVAAEWMALSTGESVCVGRRGIWCARARALSHRRQHSDQVLRPAREISRQDGVLTDGRHGLRARRWGRVRGNQKRSSETELSGLYVLQPVL